jgi:hypothetical protein
MFFSQAGLATDRMSDLDLDSIDASRISAPLRPRLAQTKKVQPRVKIANVNVSAESDDVIL